MTSCRVSCSISAMRASSKAPRSRTARAASAGTRPSPAIASSAWISISSQIWKRVSGAQIWAISGRL